MIVRGTWPIFTAFTAISMIGLLFTGVYVLKALKLVLHGPLNEQWAGKVNEISPREIIVVTPLILLILFNWDLASMDRGCDQPRGDGMVMRSLMQIPWISILILLPLATGIVLLALPAVKLKLIRWLSLATALVTFVISVLLFVTYDKVAAGYQFIEKMDWLPVMGISYHVGVDGISVALELMAGIIVLSGVLVTWQTSKTVRANISLSSCSWLPVFLVFLPHSTYSSFSSSLNWRSSPST